LKIGNMNKAKSEILRMQYDKSKGDGVYFLYRALLFPEDDRDRSLKNIASILVLNQNDYCEWLSDITKNKFRDVIFPEISDFKDQLQIYYQNELALVRDEVTDRMHKADACAETNFSSL